MNTMNRTHMVRTAVGLAAAGVSLSAAHAQTAALEWSFTSDQAPISRTGDGIFDFVEFLAVPDPSQQTGADYRLMGNRQSALGFFGGVWNVGDFVPATGLGSTDIEFFRFSDWRLAPGNDWWWAVDNVTSFIPFNYTPDNGQNVYAGYFNFTYEVIAPGLSRFTVKYAEISTVPNTPLHIVPTPGTAALLGFAGLGLARRRRR